MAAPTKLRVLELYSGIGGMHHALQESSVHYDVAAAVDINTSANEVYRHNFPTSALLQRSIESLSLKELTKLRAGMILMSPPCQPFCRVGKQLDKDDPRTKSFLYLLDTIPKLQPLPGYILVENVRGFDTSLSRQLLLDMLNKNNYNVQEFLLSPLQFGIPNSRLRYFLLAKQKPFQFDVKEGIRTDIPECISDLLIHQLTNQSESVPQSDQSQTVLHANSADNIVSNEVRNSINNSENQNQDTCSEAKSNQSESMLQSDVVNQSEDMDEEEEEEEIIQSELPLYETHKHLCRPLEFYLEKQPQEYFDRFLIPEKFLKRFWVMDIVTKDNRNSCCFTKRYAHHIEGAGSVVQTNQATSKDLAAYKQQREYNEEVEEAVRERQLRFFTPREIANLMCFPPQFSFPATFKDIQCYRVLGNSLNVHVVAMLIRLMLNGER